MTHTKNIIVTGASGFVGASLVEKLIASGFNVVGVDLNDPPLKLKKLAETQAYHHKKIDLSNELLVIDEIFSNSECPDLIFHLAGITRVRDAAADPMAAIDLNIRTTCNLYSAYQKKALHCKKRGGFLFMSTSELASLQNPTITSSVYSVTKQSAEEIIKSLFQPEAVNTAILRLCTVYGGEMELKTKVPRIFFEKIACDEEIVINAIQKINPSFIFIDDAIEMISEIGISLITKDFDSSLSSLITYTAIGEDVSLDSLIRHAEKITKHRVKYKYDDKISNSMQQNIIKYNIDYEYKNIRPKKITPLNSGLAGLWNIVKNSSNK